MTPTTTTTAALSSGALDAYQVTDADEVRAFLAEHPFLEPLLREVAVQLPRFFPGAPLRLSVDYFPDGDPHPHLLLEAVVPGWSGDAVQDALDAFDEQWWLDRFSLAGRLLMIDSAFG